MGVELHLVDTSVWLEVLPPAKGASRLRRHVDDLLAADLVATTGMVRLELLSGARNHDDLRRLGNMLLALHQLPVSEDSCTEAAHTGFQLRRNGLVVPFTDLLISAVALQAGAVVVHRDRHFDIIAAHLPLRVESHVGG